MKTKAIIFDKDGTLIDFDAFWVTISEYAVKEMFEILNCKDVPVNEALEAMGVKDGVTSINGVLCYGTYKMMAEKIYGVLTKHGYTKSFEEVEELTLKTHKNHSDKGVVKGTCPDIKGFFKGLKERGIILAVVTTDVLSVTKHCLSALGIEEYFDEIYTDDGIVPAKPAPDAAFDLCRKYSLKPSEVVMVGDTVTDINFAKNADIDVICVAKSEENRQLLLKETSTVLPDISYISLNE
ncbi:MAG: HAD family hydrolase [Clostridia bacterium]|nr:HAD family hydrolase [Clostridia bacterium]